MCVEELSKVCATTGVVVSAHTSLCIDPIMTYGTEEQKQKYAVSYTHLVYPAPTISEPVKEMIVEYTKRLAQALHVIGLINTVSYTHLQNTCWEECSARFLRLR